MTKQKQKITTIIFDVDDTLYDVSTGFTAHRNGIAAQTFMVKKLGFNSLAEAKVIRDAYFEKYHSTAKALTVAESEGKFPPMEGAPVPRFRAEDLAEYWATNLDYTLLHDDIENYDKLQEDLRECPLEMVAFSNGPRKYVKRVLKELGVWEFFGEDRLFAVDDVLPACKPEREAFQKIFDRLTINDPQSVLIVEDSMKNIRKAKEMGMKTVLVKGKPSDATKESEATKPGDAPDQHDPAVDVAIETIQELRQVMPELWEE
jgi:putative hydrolase of the HAD superfamily